MSASPVPPTTTPTLSAVKRACDSCHRRKVKCIGEGTKPCKNCVSAGLACTYNAIPQKKGPKGSRTKVLSELRETQKHSPYGHHSSILDPSSLRARSHSPRLRRTGVLTTELVNFCSEFFFANLYPSHPIIDRQQIQEAMTLLEASAEAYSTVTALCAFVALQPGMTFPPELGLRPDLVLITPLQLGTMLLEESARSNKMYPDVEHVTIQRVVVAYFIFAAYHCLDKQNTAWAYLRLAATLAHIMGLQIEETYSTVDPTEGSRRRRMFWLLFVSERAFALKHRRPISLHATIAVPSVNDDPTEMHGLTGFVHLVNLFKPLDETFFGLWNRTLTGAVPAWLHQLQLQLAEALPSYLDTTEIQAVDLRVSQLWLRAMVWQLAISHGFVSSMSSDSALQFRYPIEISRELTEATEEFSRHALETHSIGLVDKLYDIACTLTDILAFSSPSQQHQQQSNGSFGVDANSSRNYLSYMISLITTLRANQPSHRSILPKATSPFPQTYVPPTPHLANQRPLPEFTAATIASVPTSTMAATTADMSPYITATSVSGMMMRQPCGMAPMPTMATGHGFPGQGMYADLGGTTSPDGAGFAGFATGVGVSVHGDLYGMQ